MIDEIEKDRPFDSDSTINKTWEQQNLDDPEAEEIDDDELDDDSNAILDDIDDLDDDEDEESLLPGTPHLPRARDLT